MPNDAKLGMVIGVGLVILAAVVSSQRGPLGAPSSPSGAPPVAIKGPPITPVARTNPPAPSAGEVVLPTK